MKRRELVKGLAALGAMSFLPVIEVMGILTNARPHFVGLGKGGTNAIVHIHDKGIAAKYFCITGRYVSHLTPGMEHLQSIAYLFIFKLKQVSIIQDYLT